MTSRSSRRNSAAPRLFARLLGAVALILGLGALAAESLPADSGVVVNGETLSADATAAYAARFGQAPAPGRYWYDGATGAWGHEGQGTAGFVPPGLALGGPLRSDASNGRTGVWINGRQLADSDVLALAAIGVQAQPGRWWVDALGNAGPEGGPALFNLHALARRAGGDGLWRGSSDGSSLWLGGDGSLSYHGKVGDREFDYHIGD